MAERETEFDVNPSETDRPDGIEIEPLSDEDMEPIAGGTEGSKELEAFCSVSFCS